MLTFEQIDKIFAYLCRVYYDTSDVWESDPDEYSFCFVDDGVLGMNFTDRCGLQKILQEKLGFSSHFNIQSFRGNFFIYFGEDLIKVLHTRGHGITYSATDVLYAYAEQKYTEDECEVYLMCGSDTWKRVALDGEPGLAYWILDNIGAKYSDKKLRDWFMHKYKPYLHGLERGV